MHRPQKPRDRVKPPVFFEDSPSPNKAQELIPIIEENLHDIFVEEDEEINQLPDPRPAEELLIKYAPKLTGDKVFCTTLGRGQLAGLLATLNSKRIVDCHTLDSFQAHLMEDYFRDLTPNLTVNCTANVPDVEYQLVCFPVTKNGVAELTRDLLQQAINRLVPGGACWASVDNPEDTWLIDELKKFFPKVSVIPYEQGKVYHAIKSDKPVKLRDFTAEFKVRDGENLLDMISVPGVFGHREIDLGARALIEAMEIHPGDSVLDIGCGTGVCGLVAAKRATGIKLVSLDANVRAISCTRQNAVANQLHDVECLLDYDGSKLDAREFDVVLANPPYYSHFKISKIFVDTAHRQLKPNGRLYLVTKLPNWYRAYLPLLFNEISELDLRGYTVMKASSPDKSAICPPEDQLQ
jgi:16S rRNA (guanine1207-N2)-methyltransferase